MRSEKLHRSLENYIESTRLFVVTKFKQVKSISNVRQISVRKFSRITQLKNQDFSPANEGNSENRLKKELIIEKGKLK